MSTTAPVADATTPDTQAKNAGKGAPEFELGVRGESQYEQVTSMLMAFLVLIVVVVGWMALLYITNASYGRQVAAPIQIIEVYGGGGGTPDGEVGSTERIDVPDAPDEAFASSNELTPADFEEPSVELTPSAMLDALTDVADEFADLPDEMLTGREVATGRRASKIGTGGPAYGFGAGDGGVPREQRWSIIYTPQTAEEYARQLDFFGVEMATILDDQMHYVSNLSRPDPTRRVGSGQGDDRLYFLWQGEGRKDSDIELLQRAGIKVGRLSPIFHFYPQQVEESLVQLEVRYRGLQPSDIRYTRFSVVPQGRGYALQVIEQKPLN